MFATHLKGSEGHVRAEDKAAAILEFLESEHFTERNIVAELLGLKSVCRAHDCLQRMQKLGMIRYRRVPVLGGYKTLWYAGHSCNTGPVSRLQHVLDCQLARVRAERLGWTRWHRPKRPNGVSPDAAYPDATVIDPAGALVWIEIERSIKRDYRHTIINRYKAREQEGWQRCMFLSPAPTLAARVRVRIDAVSDERFYIDVDGKPTRVRLDEPLLRTLFPTRTYDTAFVTPITANAFAVVSLN